MNSHILLKCPLHSQFIKFDTMLDLTILTEISKNCKSFLVIYYRNLLIAIKFHQYLSIAQMISIEISLNMG